MLYYTNMQIISLNTWGGKQIDALKKFIEEKAEDTDIFCFQEIFSTPTENKENNAFKLNLYQQLQPILKDFNGLFAPTQDKYVFFTGYVDFELSFGLSIFVKKNIKILSSGDIFVFRKRNGLDPKNVKHTIPRNMQYIQFSLDDKDFWVCNLHGFWFPGPKTDTPERIEQSKKIIENPSIQNDYPPSAQTPATTDTREDTSGKTIQQDLQGSSEVEICNFYGIELPGKCEDYQELINPLSEENINSASAGQ